MRDPRGQVAERGEAPRVPLLRLEIGNGDQRLPQVGVLREFESFRHDANDNGRVVVYPNGLANDAGVAAIAVLPDAVAKDDDRGGARTIVIGNEVASQERGLAKQLEASRRDVGAGVALRRPALVAHVHRRAAVRGEAVERLGGFAPILEVLIRDAHVAGAHGVTCAQGQDPIRFGNRQAADQHRIDEGEDRGVDADPERQGDDCDKREPLVLDQQATRKLYVLPETHGRSSAVRYSLFEVRQTIRVDKTARRIAI